MKKLSLLLLFFALLSPAWGADKTYTFGVSPQKSASQLAESWGPVLAWLSKRSGVSLRFATARDSAEFSARLRDGLYDFCYVNPQQYTLLHEKPGYNALARNKGKRITGLLLTRKDGPVQSLQDLEGAELVFSSPTSFAASVLPQAELRKAGVHFTPRYVGSHESAYLNVVKGLSPAGGGIKRTLELASEEVRSNLRVLLTTPSYTAHAIASHPRIAEPERQKLLAAMLEMSEDKEAQPLLKPIGFKGFETATDADWDDVRALGPPPAE
jgi:phosphonate transport system substrate-binding protein